MWSILASHCQLLQGCLDGGPLTCQHGNSASHDHGISAYSNKTAYVMKTCIFPDKPLLWWALAQILNNESIQSNMQSCREKKYLHCKSSFAVVYCIWLKPACFELTQGFHQVSVYLVVGRSTFGKHRRQNSQSSTSHIIYSRIYPIKICSHAVHHFKRDHLPELKKMNLSSSKSFSNCCCLTWHVYEVILGHHHVCLCLCVLAG